MNGLACILLVFASIIKILYGSSEAFNYEDNGPDVWFKTNPTCGKSIQSPIHIETNKVNYDRHLKPFIFNNYSVPVEWNVYKNKHNAGIIQINKDDVDLSVSGSDMKQTKFNLIGAHFHWGWNDFQGSEHLINEKKYPLEMHIVHKNNIGVRVLAFLFDISEYDNPSLELLIDAIRKLRDIDSVIEMSLNKILPTEHSMKNYYRYLGSFTTPPCTEGVVWSIFQEKIKISHNQLSAFHHLELKKNFRDPQPLNGRRLTSSFSL